MGCTNFTCINAIEKIAMRFFMGARWKIYSKLIIKWRYAPDDNGLVFLGLGSGIKKNKNKNKTGILEFIVNLESLICLIYVNKIT